MFVLLPKRKNGPCVTGGNTGPWGNDGVSVQGACCCGGSCGVC